MVARREFWREEAQAAEVLAKWHISVLPVDPFLIAKSEEIICEKIRSTSPGISGCLASKDNKFGIFYGDYFSNDGFCRFTVAHELGHYFLGGHWEHLFAEAKDDMIRRADLLPTIRSNGKPMLSLLHC
jgi:Zn-dependent peptidase ImmA (M78 family)